MSSRSLVALTLVLAAAGCGRSHQIGEAPELSPQPKGSEYRAMLSNDLPLSIDSSPPVASADASLWSRGRGSLLGDRRAMARGDILTVVIQIDDSAEMRNSSERSRNGGEEMNIGALFGLPQRAQAHLPEGASLDPGVSFNSSSKASGDGAVRRNEKLELRVAATVTGTLPNGVLAIEGRQEVRVNYEMRELLVSGFVRPEDISRQNEITYDKIASARISYGGRGQISEMQQPRYGQQIVEAVLPF